MCLRRAPEKYIAGAKAPAGSALDMAGLDSRFRDGGVLNAGRALPSERSSRTRFYKSLNKPQGYGAAGRIR
jgi:hypothetical protein